MDSKINKKKAKKVLEETATKTVRYTVKTVIIFFILIIIYTVVVTIWGMLQKGTGFLEDIATLSVGGFWAFFLGYFGWRLGQTIEQYLLSMKKKEKS